MASVKINPDVVANMASGINMATSKFCSNCGKETEKCECGDQTITVSVCIPRGLLNLVNLLPKIQISADKCHKCGHTINKCSCDEK